MHRELDSNTNFQSKNCDYGQFSKSDHKFQHFYNINDIKTETTTKKKEY